MVAPITGPINTSVETPIGASYRTYRKDRSVYRQKAPFTLPLPYSMWMERVSNLGPLPHLVAVNSTGDQANLPVPLVRPAHYGSYVASGEQFALRTARSKFNGQIKPDESQLINLFLERKQNLNTLATRGTQLAAYFWLLKKDPLRAFSYVIPRSDAKSWKRARQVVANSPNYRGFKKGSRTFADLHIEMMFGLIPTYMDISAATNVLSGGVPPVRVVERGSYRWTVITGKLPTGNWNIGNRSTHALRVNATIGADIAVTNPNLFLANQLGLVNLASTAWEAAPWSFVVDYFLNVGDWLSQWTETWGLTVQQPFYTLVSSDDVLTTYYENNGQGQPSVKGTSKTQGLKIVRTIGALPRITLGIKKPWTLSARRASTSIALLLQRLPK